MARNDPPATTTLLYGNQSYSVEETARGLIDRILGDAPRDFSLHRFDAEELLKPGAGEAGEGLDAFQLACETPPFLCDRYVVRLDHLEAVRSADRGLQNLQRQLADLRVVACTAEGEPCWALEGDLAPDEAGDAVAPLGRWIVGIESRPGAPPLLRLAPEEPPPRFLRGRGEHRTVCDLKAFLRDTLKGRFAFADEADDGPSGAPATVTGRLHALLERLVEHTPPGLYLVLTASVGREGDLARGLLGKVRQHGRIEKFVTYDDYNPADWVVREARSRDLMLGRPQAGLLIHLVGNDLGRLASELDKLALAFEGGGTLDEEALLAAVHGGQGTSLFAITEKLGAKDLREALAVLEHFLSDSPNEHPVLIGILARFFRQLLHAQTLEALGAGERELASQLKLHPFLARKVSAQARHFTSRELEGIVRALAGLDVAVKRHAHLVGPLFREFVHAVCAGAFRDPQHPLGNRLTRPD